MVYPRILKSSEIIISVGHWFTFLNPMELPRRPNEDGHIIAFTCLICLLSNHEMSHYLIQYKRSNNNI